MGWGRYFYTVRDADGDLIASGLSRAGAANPPPAASSDSGGSPDGYVFAIRSVNDTWKLYFDGIQKFRTNAPGERIGKAYFLAETAGGAAIAPPRVAHIAFRAWPGGPGADSGWWQPAGNALYNPPAGFACGALDMVRFDNDPSDADIDPHWAFGQSLELGDLGADTNCNFADGAQIWPANQ
jgi:hypothetical protein